MVNCTPKKNQKFDLSTCCFKNILKLYSELSIALILYNIICILNSIESSIL